MEFSLKSNKKANFSLNWKKIVKSDIFLLLKHWVCIAHCANGQNIIKSEIRNLTLIHLIDPLCCEWFKGKYLKRNTLAHDRVK